MESVAQKRSINVDITNHIRTFINPDDGTEITREQLRNKTIISDNETELGEENKMAEDGTNGEVKEVS